MKKIAFLLFSLIFFSSFFYAQELKKQKESFIKDFKNLVEPFLKEENKSFVRNELEKTIMDPMGFSDDLTVDMISTYEILKSKNFKPFPIIYNYIYSVCAFMKDKNGKSAFKDWEKIIEKMIENKNQSKMEDFLDFSAGFFSNSVLIHNPTFDWLYRGGSYSFEDPDRPMVIFEGGNLVCGVENTREDKDKNPYVDSIVIYEAKGVFDPFLKKWKAKGGIISWEKVGLPKNETYAELSYYNLSLKSSSLECDTVILHTPYFQKPIKGKLSDRAFRINREEDKTYPQFKSFDKRLKIKQIVPNVDYDGGFSLMGKNFVGIGTGGEPAFIVLHRNSKPFIKLFTQYISINKEMIKCYNALSSIYIGTKDSIFHPNIEFNYDLKTQMIEFVRASKGMGTAPFSNSYHQVDMYIPKLLWKYDSPEIELTYIMGQSLDQRFARLESKNYFDNKLYDRLQGMNKNHPLAAIAEYCFKYDEYVLPEGKMATALGLTIEQAKVILLDLATYGFLNYDVENKIISVNQKLLTFARAKSQKIDYDNLKFEADFRPKKLSGYTDEQIKKETFLQDIQLEYDKKNKYREGLKNFGIFNLGTMEIRMEGIDMITLSDNQRTHVFPTNNNVIIRENRNFDFAGWIISGKLEINTLEANYIYNTHKVNIFKSEKTLLRVNPLQEADGKKPIIVSNELNALVGELLVDDPSNKSGLSKKFTDFPKLNVSKPSLVYYNQKSLFKGAYDSTRFYFTVDPFSMDSLDNFVEKTQRFTGELTSAGIFPKFKEPLKIMPDYSLGFTTKSAENGYPIYGNKAKFDNKILLSSKGLQGAGTITYVESTSISKGLTFLPDSTMGYAEFDNKPVEGGTEFPDIQGQDVYITLVPKNDVLKVKTDINREMTMFNKECRIKGTVYIQPFGASGNGVTTFTDANLGSKKLKFTRWEINSDTANFNVKNNFVVDDEDPLSLKTENLQAHVSFKKRKGEFKSNSGSSRVEFPVNQYLCKIDFFTWFMDKEELELSTNADRSIDIETDLDLVGANFFSLHPEQDSLQFKSRQARFSIRQKTITCKKVEYIEVGDARIFPDTNTVLIRKKANMDPLVNSEILANKITKFHKFRNCDTKIHARRKYESTGDYPYYDKDSNVTLLKMDRIWLDSTYQTTATGKITEKSNFTLSEQFSYYGDVLIKANVQHIKFSGSIRVNHTCNNFTRSYMAISYEIDPKNIQIPISPKTLKSIDSTQLFVGILWRDSKDFEEIKMYPTFLSEAVNVKDKIVFSSEGFLQYNSNTREFQIASKEKLVNRAEKGNYLAFNINTCSLNGLGKIDLGVDIEPVNVEAIGRINYYEKNGQTTMDLTLKYDIPLEENSWEKIADKINLIPDLKPMDFLSTTYKSALLEWTDQKTADKIESDYTLMGQIPKMPKEAKASIVISGIKLSSFYDSKFDEKGIISTTDKAAIVSLFGKPVFKMLPVKVFFQQLPTLSGGDKFGLYFHLPGSNQYFLDFYKQKNDGELRIYTSDGEFINEVNELKSDKKKSKNFSYTPTTNRVYLVKFLKLFGIEE
ncbi:MAG: hypothetical protein HYU67_05960 [Flavobacteriia bacterium]|nr:hypothetical protein [Flavobacteriia bacterium]